MNKFTMVRSRSAARATKAGAAAMHASAALASALASALVTALAPVLAGLFLISAAPAIAGEEKVQISTVPGVDQVRANCISCHSLDYIQMNSPFLDRKGWEATLTKMEKAFAAPIKAEDKDAILNYLTTAYGKK